MVSLTCTCDRSLSLNWTSTCRAPSSLNSFKASIALSSRSLCATRPEEHMVGGGHDHQQVSADKQEVV